jgi:hypothetical protein
MRFISPLSDSGGSGASVAGATVGFGCWLAASGGVGGAGGAGGVCGGSVLASAAAAAAV